MWDCWCRVPTVAPPGPTRPPSPTPTPTPSRRRLGVGAIPASRPGRGRPARSRRVGQPLRAPVHVAMLAATPRAARGGRAAACCGYSKVLKSRGLLILLRLSLVSDEGVYIIVARPKAICYGRTFTVNCPSRAFTLSHLVDCVTYGADFGRLQPAKQQCGCHGLKRRHSDLFPPTRNINREASCYTTEEQYGHRDRQGNRRGCPRAAILPTCLTQNCECVAKEDRMCTAPSCARECTRDFTIGNWYEPSLKL
jgi:hypothetical protein